MAKSADHLLEEATQLPADDQLRLIDQLQRRLSGMDTGLHPDWEPELERRMAEIASGTADLVDADIAIAEVRAALQKRRVRR